MALAPENSLQAFGNALSIGVSTLELDVQISQDGHPIVSHERVLPDGEFISWLTREQLNLCTLEEVIALCDARGAHDVRLNVETKFDAIHPDEVAPRERFAQVIVETVRKTGFEERVSIQSFDWAVLDLVQIAEPTLDLNVLTNVAYWEVGQPGASEWMGGVDIDDFGGSVVAAAGNRGYDTLSPNFKLVTSAFVADAHRAGLRVLPYTVDETVDMTSMIDLGCDGFITNHPDRAREVISGRGMDLPTAYPATG